MAKAKPKLTIRQKQSNASRRKRAVRKWCTVTARRVTLVGVVGLGLVATVGGWWYWHSGRLGQTVARVSDSFWQQTASLGFQVKDVYLDGRKFTPLPDVHQALGVKVGDPILEISLSEMRHRLEAIPRVKYAEIARVLPDQLHVKLVERTPAAIWQNAGKLSLVDVDGTAMEYASLKEYPNLLLVVGEDAPAHVHEVITMLSLQPDMLKQVAAAVRVGERRWNIRFKNGLELKLPEQEAPDAWNKFAELDKDHHLLARPLLYVDMRLGDRVFVKSQPGNAADETVTTKPSGKKS